MTGLYRCSFCALPPLRWREGAGYCCTHAVALGVPDTDAAYGVAKKTPQRVNTSAFTSTAKMSASEKLKTYMRNVESELRANNEWQDESPYLADRFSESAVEHEEIPELNLPYLSLDGKPQEYPF